MAKIEYNMNVFLFWYCNSKKEIHSYHNFVAVAIATKLTFLFCCNCIVHKLTFLFVLQVAVHSDVDKDMNSLFLEFCSKLLDAILRGLHRQEVHLGGKNLVDIIFANPYYSIRSYRFV